MRLHATGGCIFQRALRGPRERPLVPTFREPPGRPGGARRTPGNPLPQGRGPGGALTHATGGCIFRKRALRAPSAPSGGPRALPFSSHLSGASRQARGARRTPGNPLAAGHATGGPRRCPLVPTFPGQARGAATLPPGPEVAFSVSAPSGGHGRCPLVPTFREPPGRPGVLAAPLGTPCRGAEAPEALTCNRRLHFPPSAPSGNHGVAL